MLSETVSGDDRRGGSTDIDTAGVSQFSHGTDPMAGYLRLLTGFRQGLGNGRVRILRQINAPHSACAQSFAQLFGTNDQFLVGKGCRDVRINTQSTFLHIHTEYYYKHNFKKVNKIFAENPYF